jgi:hypothetical protein
LLEPTAVDDSSPEFFVAMRFPFSCDSTPCA